MPNSTLIVVSLHNRLKLLTFKYNFVGAITFAVAKVAHIFTIRRLLYIQEYEFVCHLSEGTLKKSLLIPVNITTLNSHSRTCIEH